MDRSPGQQLLSATVALLNMESWIGTKMSSFAAATMRPPPFFSKSTKVVFNVPTVPGARHSPNTLSIMVHGQACRKLYPDNHTRPSREPHHPSPTYIFTSTRLSVSLKQIHE